MESAENLVPREVSTAVIFLMFTLSSLANPIIYGIMNPQLQEAFKRALRFGRCGNNQINQTSLSQSDDRGIQREIKRQRPKNNNKA